MSDKPKPSETVSEIPEETSKIRRLEGQLKKRLRLKPLDILAFVGIGVIIVLLSATLVNKLQLKHQVSSAKPTADRVIADIAKQDATDTYKLADANFQKGHTIAELQKLFKPIADIYAKTPPIVVQQNVSSTSQTQKAAFVYEYARLKVPFYIRVDVTKPAGSNAWQLSGISGNADESKLVTAS